MGDTKTTLVEFVVQGPAPDEWRMVLVEQGPWAPPLDGHLSRLQDRMYGCVEAALDGQLAERFPQSHAQHVVIQIDCYDLPRREVEEFFDRFSQGVFKYPDYRDALVASPFVKTLRFEIAFDADDRT